MNRIQTRFGFSSTAAEVVEGIDLSGKRAIVTGGASGIGIETARALAKAGAEVTLAVRNLEAGQRTAADLVASTGNQRIRVARLDLVDQRGVTEFAGHWSGPLHILVNNAGGILPTLQRTTEGWEMQLAQNHLGHFALALGLHRAMAAANGARIVSVTSCGHLYSPVVFDDLQFNYRPYDPMAAYGQSKSANALFAVGATARWGSEGITANAVMPGAIASNFMRNVTPEMAARLEKEFRVEGGTPVFKSPEQGAATSVLLATSPQLQGIGGKYFENCNEAEVVRDANGYGSGVAPYALDTANAQRLWEVSVDLVKGAGGLG